MKKKQKSPGERATTILIVEDDNDLRKTIVKALRQEGYRVYGAANAGEAIECVQQREVNIIFMDICLPDRNGLKTYQVIKKIQPTAKMVMMTGFFVPDLVEAALTEGACGVLYKPFNMDDILKMIGKIMD